ncbi:VanZ family protein [Inconstantimicrobium mannanitabidum]|uniref:Uncharacterized protein n=1 Tax=Inconstantimicrobium mannanitabidum TaxID=1604901 RepID=A0ACB5RG82_9CLOT|nr:VanZ family protein [Clostridium sp. TW13]GKX68088.1 hypothetical protein rsdtw13_33460 [Clostridium sp. TW13]
MSNYILYIDYFLYACTDEIHQLFVIGRNGCIRDVFIDTFGGSTYLVLAYIYNYLKKENNNDLGLIVSVLESLTMKQLILYFYRSAENILAKLSINFLKKF